MIPIIAWLIEIRFWNYVFSNTEGFFYISVPDDTLDSEVPDLIPRSRIPDTNLDSVVPDKSLGSFPSGTILGSLVPDQS